MPLTLPFLAVPPAKAMPGLLAGNAETVTAELAGGEFATLLGNQLQPALDLTAPVAEATTAVSTLDPASIAKKALELFASPAATIGGAIMSPEANAQAGTVTIVALPATPAPSDNQLTQAIGGEDTSNEAADAALNAAIGAGVNTLPTERLVLAAALPTSVQTSASVLALDQLLDTFLPKPFLGLGPIASNKAAALASDTLNRVALGTAAPPMSPASAPEFVPGNGAPRTPTGAAQTPIGGAMVASPVVAAPSFAGRSTTARESILASGTFAPDAPLAPVLGATPTTSVSPTNTARPTDAPSLPSAPPGQSSIDAPAPTPGTPPKGEPAALNNGKASPRAIEVLRQRFEPLGLNGTITIDLKHGGTIGATAANSTSLSQSGLLTHASAAALAGQGAATGMVSAQTGLGNGANPSTLNAGAGSAGAAIMGGAQNFLGQGQGDWSGGWSDGHGLMFASSAGDELIADTAPIDDLNSSFATLLTTQSATATTRNPGIGMPLPAAPGALPSLAPEQLAVHVAAALRSGEQQIAVQLRPASLGRVDIQLSIGRDGTVRARITAERHETLDLLQRDAKGLEAAINAAGLHAESGGLSFGLNDGGKQPAFGETPMPSSLLASLDQDRETIPQFPQFRASSDGRALDIRV